MGILRGIFEGLAADVTLGGVTSPFLSWLGSAALLAFFGWHASRLIRDAARASAPFRAARPILQSLATQVEGSEIQQAYQRAFGKDRPSGAGVEVAAIDLDRLTALDESMRKVAALRRTWVQFRKTLLIEHVPWFREPRVFSTRRAEEIFTREAVVERQVDLAFYEQVPSLITGFGLLLTFVAISIGLGRLHAEGHDIAGIQGLINGLAGKFLTSIVGLVCANIFVLLERPAVRGLLAAHEEFLTLVDESFPRRTMEDLLDAIGQQPTSRGAASREDQLEEPSRATRGSSPDLGAPIEDLTSAVRALALRAQEPDEGARMLTAAVRDLERGQSRAQAQMAMLVERLAAVAASLAPASEPVARRERELRSVIPASRDGDDAGKRRAWSRDRRLG